MNRRPSTAGLPPDGSSGVDDWRIPQLRFSTSRATVDRLLFRIRVAFYHVYVAFLLGLNTVVLLPVSGSEVSRTPFLVSWIVMQAVALAFFLVRFTRQRSNAIIVSAMGGFAGVSLLWSVNQEISATYVSMLVCNVVVAYLVATDLSVAQIVALCSRVIVAMALVSIVLYFAGNEQVIYFDDHGRPNFLGGQAFRGLFSHKILAALYMALAIVFVLARRRGLYRAAVVGLLGLGILLTGSASGIVVLVVAVSSYWLLSIAQDHRVGSAGFARLLALVIGTGAICAWVWWEDMLAALGRDDTLTGRTDLWAWGLRAFIERPIFGWGFDAYVNSPHIESVYMAVPSFRNWKIPHFHQSFIQTAVDFGVIGVAFLVYVIASSVRRSLILATSTGSRSATALFASLVTLTAASFVMFLFFNYNHFATFFLMASYFVLNAEFRRRLPGEKVLV